MKKYILILATLAFAGLKAQTRGTKIGYIDMEYILQNVPDYIEAQNQLEQKAQKWKQEIEAKKNEINKLKEALKIEKALLTKGLIEERLAEIVNLETENLDYQQKRFGPEGDLIVFKRGLTKPIQDQVFTAVQDIAEAKKYDFIFDKSSDLTMLFTAKRFDISDQIIRVLTRTEKREKLTKKQQKEEAAKEARQDAMDANPALEERKKVLEERKAAREKALADRIAQQEERKKAIESLKNQNAADRTAKQAKTGSEAKPAETTVATSNDNKQKTIEQRASALDERRKAAEDARKAAEEKRKQILAEREARKTGTVSESSSKETTKPTTNADENTTKVNPAEAQKQEAEAREKALQERKKTIEERQKALEERKQKILEEREAAKKAAAEKVKTN